MKEEDKISYDIRGAAFKVYNELGPGLLESVYEAAMDYVLQKMGKKVRTQVPVPVIYGEVKLELLINFNEMPLKIVRIVNKL